jgi:hypothetical protein
MGMDELKRVEPVRGALVKGKGRFPQSVRGFQLQADSAALKEERLMFSSVRFSDCCRLTLI